MAISLINKYIDYKKDVEGFKKYLEIENGKTNKSNNKRSPSEK